MRDSQHIFISYSHDEYSRAQQFERAFSQLGWRVWLDTELHVGQVFDVKIQEALDAASCVVVLWSARSLASHYVLDEAFYALEKEKLIPVALEQVELPFRFQRLHTTELFDWNGDVDSPTFRALTHDIEVYAGLRQWPPSSDDDTKPRGRDADHDVLADEPDGDADPLRARGRRFLRMLPLCGGRCRKSVNWILLVIVAAWGTRELTRVGFNLWAWDLLLFSGAIVLALGLYWAAKMPERFRHTISRLSDSGVLRLRGLSPDGFADGFEHNAEQWEKVTGLVVAVSIAIAFWGASSERFNPWLLGAAEAVGGYIAGTYLGRMAYYGQVGKAFERMQIVSETTIKIDPSYADGVSGLSPVGRYFLIQAGVSGIPAIFLASWLIVFQFVPMVTTQYTQWYPVYLGLLVLAIALEISAFVVPLLAFHRLMSAKKQQLMRHADFLSRRIKDLEAAPSSWRREASESEADISRMRRRHDAIKQMKTWPVDFSTGRVFFSVNTLLLAILLALVINLLTDVAL